jgi:WS/DGAT/MGAT family acyltransferase
VRQVYEHLRSFPVTAEPFNYVLRGVGDGRLRPTFVVARKIDLDYHLRHSALPYPGGERELGVLVSRLHSNPMDFDRPLWEIHLIEGLHDGRFALYAKLHHSLADGVSGVGLLNFSSDPGDSATPPVWAAERPQKARSARHDGRFGTFANLNAAISSQAKELPSLLQGLAGTAKAAFGVKPSPDFTSLAEAPRTIFNVNVTPQRRVATQSTSLERLKRIGVAAGGSINDVVLAACSAALRRYLLEIDQLPRKSLVTSIPVALPRDTSQAGGNAISFANVRLGTDVEDVRERFDVIRRSSIAGRDFLKQMSTRALMDYTVLISSPQILTRIPGIGSRIPPTYNIIISNVPGPRGKLYFMGSEMEAYYPISALAHGQALNITVLSYAGGLYFGYTGCADKVPHLQRLAVYTGEAIDELERVFVEAAPTPARKSARKAKTQPKAKTSAKAKARSKTASRRKR